MGSNREGTAISREAALTVLQISKTNMDSIPAETDLIVWGIVYVGILVFVDDDEPLKGTAYVGQAVRCKRCKTPEQLAAIRWKEHETAAKSDPKMFGIRAAIEVFGFEAIEWSIIASKQGLCEEVQAWANELEIQEIANRGGTLRDMHPSVPMRQTFNLRPGGKGDKRWVIVEAFCTDRWKVFRSELQAYVDEHQSALVPQRFVSSTGFHLGNRVNDVRCGKLIVGRPDEAERRKWLESLPRWVWNARETDEFKVAQQERAKKQFESKEARQVLSERMKRSHKNPVSEALRLKSRSATLKRKTRARLEKARREALPFERVKLRRIAGSFYISRDGRNVQRCGSSLKLTTIGPVIDKPDRSWLVPSDYESEDEPDRGWLVPSDYESE